MKFTNAEEGSKEYRSMIRWCSTFTTIIVCILLLMCKDFFTDLMTDKHSYEVKLVKEDTLENGQDAYRLFKDGYEVSDVDYNEYYSLDDNGNTDVNLSNLKTGKMKGVRFETMEAICKALDCQPGDLFEYKE